MGETARARAAARSKRKEMKGSLTTSKGRWWKDTTRVSKRKRSPRRQTACYDGSGSCANLGR